MPKKEFFWLICTFAKIKWDVNRTNSEEEEKKK